MLNLIQTLAPNRDGQVLYVLQPIRRQQKSSIYLRCRIIPPTTFILSLLISFTALSQPPAPLTSTQVIYELQIKLNAQSEIDRDTAIKYFHLDSMELQEYSGLHSESSLVFGSHPFWIVSYAANTNCRFTRLIEYNKASKNFCAHMLLATDCDFDLSGDHTYRTSYRVKANTLFVYENYYRIKDEDLVLVKKKSTYSAYQFPALTRLFEDKPQQ